MGVIAALAAAALLLAGSGAAPLDRSARYLQARQAEDGGFAERGGRSSAGLTAWAVLGLRAAGATPSSATRSYLAAHEPREATDVALQLLARAAAGEETAPLVARLRTLQHRNGAIGPTLNSTIWAVLALRQAGQPVPTATRRLLLSRQTSSGGWGWAAGVAADSNDTAAAVQALRALGVRGAPIKRALVFLRRHQNRDGGFELTKGRGSDSQSTAWAVQGFLAAGAAPPRDSLAYLARMRRADGSYRYSARYAVTPVWVTAQVLPAVARKPFPLRGVG